MTKHLIIKKNEDGQHCIHEGDENDMPMGKPMSCHDSAAEARAKMAEMMGEEGETYKKALEFEDWLDEQPGPVLVDAEAFRELCEECADGTKAWGIEQVDLKAMPSALLRGLCKSLGGDAGFFTRCMAKDLGKFSAQVAGNKEGFCAWLHKKCIGKWPGKKRGHKADGFEVKAVEGKLYEIEILVPYGGPLGAGVDRVGDYFDKSTDFSVPGLPDLPRPVMYAHAQDDPTPDPIGTAVGFRDDERGRWYRVILDRTKQKARQIWEAIPKGTVKGSSQAVFSFVRRIKDAIGERVTHWPIVELTLVDEAEGRHRAVNPFAVVQPAAAKSMLATVGLAFDGSGSGSEELAPSISAQRQALQRLAISMLIDEE